MEIRSYQNGDELHILNLFKSSFGKTLSEEYWKWRFADHPEKKMMIMLMWDTDLLVGHYAVSPIRMCVEGEEVLTALSMTTMTHPDYMGRGIFSQLAESLYEEERTKNNLAAVWGFPNNNSHYGFIKNVGWKNLVQIPTFSSENISFKEVNSDIKIGNRFEARHCKSRVDSKQVRVNKDANYYNWRYKDNPSNKYDLFEKEIDNDTFFAVTKKYASFEDKDKTEIDILEWEVPTEQKSQEEFLNEIIRHYTEYKPIRINMWMPLDDPRHIMLEKCGFRNLAPITYSGIRLLSDRFESMLDQNKWHYCLGYSDIY